MVRVASPTFVGRGAELAALDEALEAAAGGRTTTVLISGDPGVGKTRLLETWNPRARDRGARIAIGSCLDLGETGPAFTAVVEALREVMRGLDPGEEEALVGADRSVLARIVPELGRPSDFDSTGSQPSTFAQARLFDRLVDVLQRAVDERAARPRARGHPLGRPVEPGVPALPRRNGPRGKPPPDRHLSTGGGGDRSGIRHDARSASATAERRDPAGPPVRRGRATRAAHGDPRRAAFQLAARRDQCPLGGQRPLRRGAGRVTPQPRPPRLGWRGDGVQGFGPLARRPIGPACRIRRWAGGRL